MDNRGVTTVVAKLLALGIVVLYVGGMTTVLFGGAVPEYRAAAGGELADRVLATAADRIQSTVPPDARVVSASRTVDLPATIRGAAYDVAVDNRTLVLDHPSASIGGRARLALPDHVDSIAGDWQSGARTVVVAETAGNGVAIRLVEGRP